MLSEKIIFFTVFAGIVLVLIGIFNFDYYSNSSILPISFGIGLIGVAGISRVMV